MCVFSDVGRCVVIPAPNRDLHDLNDSFVSQFVSARVMSVKDNIESAGEHSRTLSHFASWNTSMGNAFCLPSVRPVLSIFI